MTVTKCHACVFIRPFFHLSGYESWVNDDVYARQNLVVWYSVNLNETYLNGGNRATEVQTLEASYILFFLFIPHLTISEH